MDLAYRRVVNQNYRQKPIPINTTPKVTCAHFKTAKAEFLTGSSEAVIHLRENCTDTHETYVICANTHVRIRILTVFQLLYNS